MSSRLDKIICNIENLADLEALASLSGDAGTTELTKLGFTSVTTSVSTQSMLSLPAEPAEQLEHAQSLDELITEPSTSSESLWESLLGSDLPLRFHGASEECEQAALMLQMSLPRLPIYDLNQRLVPDTAAYASRPAREFRELLRSLTFWRTRFRIGHTRPRLVHADDSGLLIYIIDSWLIALNFTDDDVSVDVGTGGAMWLMLATGHSVHLHGSLLELPANSGAILANELAR